MLISLSLSISVAFDFSLRSIFTFLVIFRAGPEELGFFPESFEVDDIVGDGDLAITGLTHLSFCYGEETIYFLFFGGGGSNLSRTLSESDILGK